MSINYDLYEEHSQMLFDDDLGTASNQSELDGLLKKHEPRYDRLYVCLATRFDLKEVREWIEASWVEYKPFADKNFPKEFKTACHERAWELYLGITLNKRWGLASRDGSTGPDFKTIHTTNSVVQTIWIEATAPEKGMPRNSNSVPEMKFMEFDEVASFPENQMLLRLIKRLNEKFAQYSSYLEKNVVCAHEPYIIAINRSNLEHLDTQIPLALKCLFGLGNQILFGEPQKLNLRATETVWEARDHIEIVNAKEPVPLGFFNEPAHAGISAVIYMETDIINSPLLPEEMGNNFTIVLNPYANNPLPEELLTFGNIWRKEGDHIFLINTFSPK